MVMGVRLAAGVEVGSMVMVGRRVARGIGEGMGGGFLVAVASGPEITVAVPAAGAHPASRQVNIRERTSLFFMVGVIINDFFRGKNSWA
jgi:hypothetical protein